MGLRGNATAIPVRRLMRRVFAAAINSGKKGS
jgi:hypothetical protein